MRFILSILRATVFFQVIGVSTGLAAERLANVLGPAELPPASFAGEQFVDSTGCVFLRAGSYGAIKWVPRVTQQRKLVCGLEPSFASSKTTVKKAMPLSVQTPVKPQTPVLAAPGEIPKTNSVPGARKPGLAAVFSSIMTRKNPPSKQAQISPSSQIVRQDIGPTQVPSGYMVAWDDDRLNPERGLQSVNGLRDSDQIWSRTVPREMVSQSASDHRTHDRKLVYPFTNLKQQTAFLEAQDEYVLKPQDGGAIILVPRSTKNSNQPVRNIKPARSSGRATMVQVASFAVQKNAENTKARLAAMGLPVQQRLLSGSGKTYRVILLGPFANDAQRDAALASVRRAGFKDAFISRQ